MLGSKWAVFWLWEELDSSAHQTQEEGRNAVSVLGISLLVVALWGSLCCSTELMICEGNPWHSTSTWWWVTVVVSCRSEGGTAVLCCHRWEYVPNLTVFFTGWRIHVIKQSFSLFCLVCEFLCCYCCLWHLFLLFFFPRYFYGLCHSSVSASRRHLWIYSENVPVR